MVITSEIILSNISSLEKAKRDFPILQQYENCNDYNMSASLKEEANNFNLSLYVDFIDFIKLVKRNNQQVFYRKKIKNKEFQDELVRNAYDDDAKKCFKSKGPTTFQTLLNSDKWDVFSGKVSNYRRKIRRWTDNFSGSEAIIANFIIQNKLDIHPDLIHRVSKFYTQSLPSSNVTLLNEVNMTTQFIEFVISKISESDIDFKRLNFTHLTKSLQNELRDKILRIDFGEKIKCIENIDGKCLTLHKVYDVLDKKLDSANFGGGNILYVYHINDDGHKQWTPYRFFETVRNIRDNALDELLKD